MKRGGSNLVESATRSGQWEKLIEDIVVCRKCPRLVRFRERIAKEKTKRFEDWEYWARPVPGFGDRNARLVIIGLAPAAHGGNRTGRVFTGDLSAKFLVDCLHSSSFSNQPNSDSLDDGLELMDAYMLAAVRCVPPDNRPTVKEAERCFPFLARELDLLENCRVVLLLGRFAFEAYLRYLNYRGLNTRGIRFRHGARFKFENTPAIYASYHPSPRNTNTGTLTKQMFLELLEEIRGELDQR